MRGRLVAVLVGAVAVIATGVLLADGLFSAPAGQPRAHGTAPVAEPAVTETGVARCPVPLPNIPDVAGLSGVKARCLGSSQQVDVGAAVAGTPTLLNLWASWCAPCRDEMPVLDAYRGARGAVRVVGVNLRDRASSAAALMRELGIGYPTFTDADSVAAALRAPQLLPLSYLVDTDGTVRRLPTTVFRDVAAITEAVARAEGQRQ